MKHRRLTLLISCSIAVAALSGCDVYPPYRVYSQEMDGKAELAKADYSKQVAVQEAKAKQESAKYEAEAEVTRARGVAQANQIIGESLKNNEAYLRYLWVNKLDAQKGQVIYVPTEAGMPMMEAGRGVVASK